MQESGNERRCGRTGPGGYFVQKTIPLFRFHCSEASQKFTDCRYGVSLRMSRSTYGLGGPPVVTPIILNLLPHRHPRSRNADSILSTVLVGIVFATQ